MNRASSLTVPVVELIDVVLDYVVVGSTVRAVDHVSLALDAGTSTAVVGRSGSGKSSLVSVLALMRTPSSGRVLVDGQVVRATPGALRAARARNVAMVFQSFHLEPHLTAVENTMLAWFAGMGRLTRRAAAARASEVVDLVGLGHMANRRVADMSGGERQRVAIARALFREPRLLVADEPTGNLDETTAGAITALLWGLPSLTGAAVVVVTHDGHVASGADRIVHLSRGQIETPVV